MPPLIIAAAGMALSEAAATAASAAVATAATATAASAGAAAASAAIAGGATAAGAASAAVAGLGSALATGSMLADAAYAGTMLATSTLLGMAANAVNSPKAPGIQMRAGASSMESRRIPCGKVWTAGRKMSNLISWGSSNKHAIFLRNIADVPIGGIASFTATADDGTTQTYNGFFVDGYPAVFRNTDDTKGYEISKTVNTYTLGKVASYLTGKNFKFFVKFHFGSSDQVADQWMLNHLNSSRWDDTAVGVGISYARICAYYDTDIFNAPPDFNFYLNGAKFYNPSLDSTVGGSGSHVWGDESTYETTTNPAVIAYNIARGIYVNGVFFYGGLYEEDDLPVDYWIAAINACAETITDKDGSTSPRYSCGFEIDVTHPPSEYLKICETAMAGRIVKDRGQLLAFAGVAQTPVFTFTDNDMVSGTSNQFVPKLGLDQLKNTVTAKYVSSDQAFARLDAPPHYSDDDVAEDGGITLTDNLDLSMIYHCPTAQRVMEVFRQRHRAQGTATRTFLATALNARVGEWIAGTSASWDGTKWFEIIKSVVDPRALTVTMSLREVSSSLGDWDADTDELDAYDVSMDSADAVDPLEATGITADALSDLGSDGTANASVTITYDVETDDDGETDSTINGVVLQIGKVLLRTETGISDATTDFTDDTGAGFTSDMAGHIIAIDAAGEDGDQYSGTVSAYVSGTEVTLADATDTAGTGLTYMVIDSTQYVYSDSYSEGQITAANLLGETTYAYRIRLSGIEGRSATWSDWYVITTTATSTSDSANIEAIEEELAEQKAKEEALETAKSAIAAQQTALAEALDTANALLTQVAALVAAGQQSSAISYQQTTDKLSSSFAASAAQLAATIQTVKTTAASATKAVAQEVETLDAALTGYTDSGAIKAAFEEITEAYVSADTVLGKRASTLEAALTGYTDSGSVSAKFSSVEEAFADADDALSERIETQEALVGDASSSATLQIDTSATSDDGAAAIVTATLTATDGTNTATVGFEAEAVVEDSTVVNQWNFIADRVNFSPSSDSDAYAYIDAQNGRIVFDDGSYMLVMGTGFGTTGDISVWYGPTQSAIAACSPTNAMFCLAKSGSYFRGTLKAGTLETDKATSSIDADASVETAEFGSNGGTITVTLSYSYTASYTVSYSTKSEWLSAVNALGLTENSTTNYSGSGKDSTSYVDLYRATAGGDYASAAVDTLDCAGSYTVTAEYDSGGDGGFILYIDKISGSLTFTDPETSTEDRQYKAVLRTRGATYTMGVTQNISIVCVEE